MINHFAESEIYFCSEKSVGLTFSAGELKIKEGEESAGYGIRIVSNGRIGFSYCQTQDKIKNVIETARNTAKFSPKTNFDFAPQKQYRNLNLSDRKINLEDYQELKDFVEHAREGAESLSGNARIMLSVEKKRVHLENTNGANGEYERTQFSTYIETMDNKTEGFGFSYFSNIEKPKLKELRRKGEEAAQMAEDMKNAKKPENGNYVVIMNPETLESLIEILLPSFSGDWKRRAITKLRENIRAFSEQLTIYEDGLAEGIDKRPFDDEGVPSQKRLLIERGRVKNFFFDRETAALARVQADGSCSRAGYDTSPTIGHSNIHIGQGKWKSLDDLRDNECIEIYSMHGSHTANTTTGNFGLEVNVAFHIKNKVKRPIRGFMIVGNIFELFSAIEGMEKTKKIFGSLVAPRIAFRNVQIIRT